MDLTNKNLGGAGQGKGGVGHLCCLPPSHPQRITKKYKGGSGHLDVFPKVYIFFLRDGFPKKSLPKEKCFLVQNMTLTPHRLFIWKNRHFR